MENNNTATAAEVKEAFNSEIARESNPDRIAKLELLREYFTNPEFRRKLEDHVWSINHAA